MTLALRSVAVDAWRPLLVDRAQQRSSRWRHEPEDARAAAESAVDQEIAGSTVWEVHDGDQACGWVWVAPVTGDLAVLDLEVADLAVVPWLRDQVVAFARSTGRAGVQASASPGHAAEHAFVSDPAFAITATHLQLDLRDRAPVADRSLGLVPMTPVPMTPVPMTPVPMTPVPMTPVPMTPAPMILVPMTEAELQAFIEADVEEYAAERHAAGEPLDDARRIAREQTASLLPAGVDSPHQHLFIATVEDQPVGTLWLGTERTVTFVYDVRITPDRQGQGLGTALMNAAADWARGHGAPAIGLNVFAHNPVARALYDKLGYQVVEDHLRARLASPEPTGPETASAAETPA